MRGSTFWLASGILLFLAWGVSYFVFYVTGVLIHLLLVFALMSFMLSAFVGKTAGDLEDIAIDLLSL